MGNLNPRRVTRREHIVDNYHGTNVADPYRWLEDDTAPEVQQWMEEQNGDFQTYINGFDIRQKFTDRITGLMNYAKCGLPAEVEGVYYTWRNDGLQNQHVLYRSDNIDEIGDVILDPNTLKEDGTVSIKFRTFSPQGKYMAYG